MKKYSSIICIVGLACAGLIFNGCATNQATAPIPPNSGHLLINRVANFGADLSLVVSVDGKNVGSFTEGRNYSGYLPAGQHTIVVRLTPIRAESTQDKNPNCASWTHLFLHRSVVGKSLVLVMNQGQTVLPQSAY